MRLVYQFEPRLEGRDADGSSPVVGISRPRGERYKQTGFMGMGKERTDLRPILGKMREELKRIPHGEVDAQKKLTRQNGVLLQDRQTHSVIREAFEKVLKARFSGIAVELPTKPRGVQLQHQGATYHRSQLSAEIFEAAFNRILQ